MKDESSFSVGSFIGWVTAACAGILLISFVTWIAGMLFGLITLPVHTITNTVQTAHDVTDKVVNADQALYNYEWFKDQEQSIKKVQIQETQALQAVKDYESKLPEDRSEWSDNQEDRDNFLSTTAQGFTYELDQEIADWNSNSAKVNRSLWKNNLPMTISRTVLTTKEALTDREGRQ